MSIALMIAAAYLPSDVVGATEKLTLMKLADSADDDTRLSVPTHRRLVAWVGVSVKRVSTLITQLVAKGLVERVLDAREGRAAVYRVFPDGVPMTPQREELDDRLRELRERPKNPKLARKPKARRRRPAPPARTYLDVQARRIAALEDAEKGAGFPDGNPLESQERVSEPKPSGSPEGNHEGFERETPSFPSPLSSGPSSSTPHTPAPSGAGVGGEEGGGDPTATPSRCPRHPDGDGANCRACGTTARQVQRRRDGEQRAATREANRAWWEGWREEEAGRREAVAGREEEVEALRRATRDGLRRGRAKLRRPQSES
ncbi:helix-turn-helix domain-containing protein [Streptomyces albidoflavus]|uniref:helix-turn-helix domain-containing protein n=1 Tax=Streptomyces albidoflavus TaxID=1886 RepID=UPI0033D0C163